MSAAKLKQIARAWPSISRALRVPRNEREYQAAAALLDRVTDEVGED